MGKTLFQAIDVIKWLAPIIDLMRVYCADGESYEKRSGKRIVWRFVFGDVNARARAQDDAADCHGGQPVHMGVEL